MGNAVLDEAAAAPAAPRRGRRRVALAVAAVVMAGVAAAAATLAGGDEPASEPSSLRLGLPDPTVMASCLAFDVDVLRDMSPAFAGTVTSLSAEQVVLDVDRWYTGGDADRVVLDLPDGSSSAALDGVAFAEGDRYLVTAADGTVNGCGFSGPATPQLQAAYDEAFGG